MKRKLQQKWVSLASLLFLLMVGVGLSVYYNPFYFHFAGTDASNYVNLAEKYLGGQESANVFYSDSWEITTEEVDLINQAFTDMRGANGDQGPRVGLMTPYVFVDNVGKIVYPHFHLFSFLLIGFETVSLDGAYLNYVLLILSSFLMFGLVKKMTKDSFVSLCSAVLMFVIPSLIMGARYPLSEGTALFLNLFMLWVMVRKWPLINFWGLLVLMPLTWARPEFLFITFFVVIFCGFFKKKVSFYIPVLLVLNFYFLFFYYTSINFSYAPTSIMFRFLIVGLFAPFMYGVGMLLGKFFKRQVIEVANWIRNHFLLLLMLFFVSVGFIDLIKMFVLAEGGSFLFMEHARFSTFRLLVDSFGWPFFIIAATGLVFLFKHHAKAIPGILYLLLLPHLLVFVSMQATPTNEWFWTRRFHEFVYPFFIFSAGYFFYLLARKLGRKKVISCLVLISLIIGVNCAEFKGFYHDYLTYDNVKVFHDSATGIEGGAIVILGGGGMSKKAQLPLRTFHGLWAYVTWDKDHLEEALPIFFNLNKPIYIESTIFDGSNEIKEEVYLDVYVSDRERSEIHLVRIV